MSLLCDAKPVHGIWVCKQNGNIKNGDFITSSDLLGVGMRQESPFIHNYTVAKATCDIDFENVGALKTKLIMENHLVVFIGCTYHCG